MTLGDGVSAPCEDGSVTASPPMPSNGPEDYRQASAEAQLGRAPSEVWSSDYGEWPGSRQATEPTRVLLPGRVDPPVSPQGPGGWCETVVGSFQSSADASHACES